MIYLYLVGGLLCHLVLKIRDAYTQRKKFDWRRHLTLSAFNLLIGAIIVFLFACDAGDHACKFALFTGYAVDSVIKNLEGMNWRSIKT